MRHRACGTVATHMDRARKRRTRLVVATSAAVVFAGALVYTSFSAASDAKDPSQLAASAVAGRSYQLTGTVVPGYRQVGQRRCSSASATAKRNASVPVRYTGVVPDPFRAGREVIVTVREQGRSLVGEQNSLMTKCPSKYSAEPVRTRDVMALTGRAPLILALLSPLTASRRRCTARARAARVGGLRAPRGVRARGADDARVRDPRGGVPALGLLVQRGRGPLVDDDADVLQADRAVVLAGGLAAAVGVAAVAVVEPGAVLDAGPVREIVPYATAILLGFATFFPSLAVFYANPFATTSNPPAEGAGLDPLLLHPSMMIHPPMLYSGYTLLTSRSRSRSAR